MIKKLVIFFLLAPLLAVTLWAAKAYYLINIWQFEGEAQVFQVRSGEAFPSINGRLAKVGLISSSRIFYRYAQYHGLMGKFRRGSYLIPSGSKMPQVIEILVYGKPIEKRLTIPEGRNLYEIGKILEQNGLTTYAQFLNAAKDPQLIRSLGIPAEGVEGYLYPDTYQFPDGSDAESIIRLMVDQSKKQLDNAGLKLGDLKAHSVVILASIVEKETGAGHERPMIAGVFLNRLKKRMRLQSDPTTIYGVYEDYQGNITKAHLQQKTEYNTYKINGLPKGPISNPGIEAIQAVLNPAKHDYLYFVSKNDGTHIFSETYQEHNEAVNEFQRKRHNRQGKSWRDLSKKAN